MAYHCSPLFPSAPSVRSRLSPAAASGRQAERPGLLESLHQLAFERGVRVDDGSFRVGLAATPLHLQHSQDLLRAHGYPLPGAAHAERAVVLALSNSLHGPSAPGALGTIWLRREPTHPPVHDGARMAAALQALQATGRRAAVLECVAITPRAPNFAVFEAMLWSIREIALEIWQATDILAECPSAHVEHYCSRHGFIATETVHDANVGSILRLPTQYPTREEQASRPGSPDLRFADTRPQALSA